MRPHYRKDPSDTSEPSKPQGNTPLSQNHLSHQSQFHLIFIKTLAHQFSYPIVLPLLFNPMGTLLYVYPLGDSFAGVSPLIRRKCNMDICNNVTWTSVTISFTKEMRSEIFANLLGYKEPNLIQLQRCKGQCTVQVEKAMEII